MVEDSKPGILVVITGASGAGKDAVMEDFLKTPFVKENNFKQVVTCTDRAPRIGETEDIHYHFVSKKGLQKMEKDGKLVEPIKNYGTSNKATPRIEIERFINGQNLIWRIDPSLASQVASGKFFKREFCQNSEILQKHTIVIFVTAPKEVIENRRKKRDGKKYELNRKDYEIRDKQDEKYLSILEKNAISAINLDGKLDKTVDTVVKSITNYYDKI